MPDGTSTVTGEPTRRSWSVGVAVVDERAVRSECCEAACDPSFHSRVSTLSASGSTAVTNSVVPKMRASPVRVLAIASTPGAFAAASAASVGIGEKLFCAVMA